MNQVSASATTGSWVFLVTAGPSARSCGSMANLPDCGPCLEVGCVVLRGKLSRRRVKESDRGGGTMVKLVQNWPVHDAQVEDN